MILGVFPSLLSKCLSYIPVNWSEVECSDEYIGGLSQIVFLLNKVKIDADLVSQCATSLITSTGQLPTSTSAAAAGAASGNSVNNRGLLDELVQNMLPSGNIIISFYLCTVMFI